MKRIILIITFLMLTGAYYPVSAQETATGEADTVRERVREKLEEALKNPKAFIGVITEKTGENLQIRTDTGTIEQISVSSITTYAMADKSSQRLTFKEVAIGDYAIIMGYRDPNNIIEAKRILVLTQPLVRTKRSIVKGRITDINKNQLTVAGGKDNSTIYVKPAAKAAIINISSGKAQSVKFASIHEQDIIIAIGDMINSLVDARRIIILSSSVTPTPTKKP